MIRIDMKEKYKIFFKKSCIFLFSSFHVQDFKIPKEILLLFVTVFEKKFIKFTFTITIICIA